MALHNEIGILGEELARDYLRSHGYTVVETNTHIGHKEIDIIATKNGRIIFVEVKTRTNDQCDPIDAIDNKKINKLVRAANSYIQTFNIKHEPQFDIITIIIHPDGSHKLTHYEDAFLPPLYGAY